MFLILVGGAGAEPNFIFYQIRSFNPIVMQFSFVRQKRKHQTPQDINLFQILDCYKAQTTARLASYFKTLYANLQSYSLSFKPIRRELTNLCRIFRLRRIPNCLRCRIFEGHNEI